jgi:hypothetical protein
MKKNNSHLAKSSILALFIVLSVSASLLCQEIGLIVIDAEELSRQLTLTEEQQLRVQEIMKIIDVQAEKDRQLNKKNALALIQASKRRNAMMDNMIEEILTPAQKEKYGFIKLERDSDEEYFELKEGLCLSDEQALQVKYILEKSRNEAETDRQQDQRDRRDKGMRSGIRGGMPGSMGGRRGGMMGRNRPNPDDMIKQIIKKREGEKEKEIENILTKEQKKLYKQIKKERHKKLEKEMRERFEKMSPPINRRN